MFKYVLSTLACLAVPTNAVAQASDGADLAKKLSNPVADLISVPLQYNFNDGYGDGSSQQSYLNIQPVIPISISPGWNVISRTIIPLVEQKISFPVPEHRADLATSRRAFSFLRRRRQPTV